MILEQILSENGVSGDAVKLFTRYYELLTEWNAKINLTAITDEKGTAEKHFLDSLGIERLGLIPENAEVIDVGTGAGFPGIPLKIVRGDIGLTLLDSLLKRINFLNEVVLKLGLSKTETIHLRAEEAGASPEYREKYDVCVSRAVANLTTLSELCLPFVKPGGCFVSLKGPMAAKEAADAERAIKLLGGELADIKSYTVSDTDLAHNAVIVKKISQTPTKYPRKAPKPSKEPLL